MCVSGVLAGVSEVLIKYTGNVWLHMVFQDISFFFLVLEIKQLIPEG